MLGKRTHTARVLVLVCSCVLAVQLTTQLTVLQEELDRVWLVRVGAQRRRQQPHKVYELATVGQRSLELGGETPQALTASAGQLYLGLAKPAGMPSSRLLGTGRSCVRRELAVPATVISPALCPQPRALHFVMQLVGDMVAKVQVRRAAPA